MSRTLIIQLLLVIAGVFLAIYLWLAPRNQSSQMDEDDLAEVELPSGHSEDDGHQHEQHSNSSAQSAKDDYYKDILKGKEGIKAQIEELESRAEEESSVKPKLAIYDNLIQISKQENLPPFVALYTKRKAETVSTPNNWMLTGDNYFKAFRLSKNQSKAMLDGAIEAYEKALQMDPNKLAAKTALGVAYVEGAALLGEMPMKGIGMLKEVLNIDPENVDAITNLGYFAIQSGQYEKAIERFNQALKIDPRNAEAYLYLTDVYLSQGEKDKGIETLTKYKELMDDPLVDQRVDQYINEIRSN